MAAELPALFDPDRPHRRIFHCAVTGKYVKVYTRREDAPFGRLVIAMTGSECDANGDALAFGEGHRVLADPSGAPMRHLYQGQGEAAAPPNFQAELDVERLAFVQRVIQAAIEADKAATLVL